MRIKLVVKGDRYSLQSFDNDRHNRKAYVTVVTEGKQPSTNLTELRQQFGDICINHLEAYAQMHAPQGYTVIREAE